jgi:hypothetical protein
MEATSRYQRLFEVLENGTTPATRFAAAEQIAEIFLQMSESPRADFLNVLFQKVSPSATDGHQCISFIRFFITIAALGGFFFCFCFLIGFVYAFSS